MSSEKVEQVEQSGKPAVVPLFSQPREQLSPEWKSGTGKLEACAGITVTVEPSSLNRSALKLRAGLEELLERFLLAKRGEGGSPETLTNYRQKLRELFRYLAEERVPVIARVSDVTTEHLIGYRDSLLSREKKRGEGFLSVNSVWAHVGAIRRFFEFLASSDEILLDPARYLKGPRKPRHLPRDVPTIWQMRRLLTARKRRRFPHAVRDRAILEVLYGTGLRNSELCNLELSDYSAEKDVLFVRHGKGGKDRVVPVGQKAREALERYLWQKRATARGRERARIFLTQYGTPITTEAVRDLVERAGKRAGLKQRVRPHSLRHACATHLLKGQADIRSIQALLGHASLSTTEIYTRVDTTDLKRVLRRCHPREQKQE